jgi:hypothetical protein
MDDQESRELAVSIVNDSQSAVIDFQALKSAIPNNGKVVRSKDLDKTKLAMGSWIFSYKMGGSNNTDKLVLNNIKTEADGSVYLYGLYYPNFIGSGYLITCGYEPSSLYAINADFLCATQFVGLYQSFAFRFSGDVLTSGLTAVGLTASDAGLNLIVKNYPMTGYRMAGTGPQIPTPTPTPTPSPSPTPTPTPTPLPAQDEYNSSTGDLTLPSVKVGTASYKAILNTKDGTNFVLKSATKN